MITAKRAAALRVWGDGRTETRDPVLPQRSDGQYKVRENDDVLAGDASAPDDARLGGNDGWQQRHPPFDQTASVSPELSRMKARCSRSERCALAASCDATALKMRRC